MASLVGHDGNYCCFALTRGFERTCAATSEKNAWLTTQIRQPPARENLVDATGGTTTGGRTTYSLQWTRRGTLRPCATFWCAASACSMGTRHSTTCSKKTHTQRHGDARCQHASELKRWSKRPRSQTVTKKNLSHDGLRRSRSFGISVSTMGGETTPSNSPPKKPQPLLCAHPSVGHKNLLIDCGDDIFSNDLLLNSSAVLFWRSSEPVASDVVKLPVYNGKPTTHTLHGTSSRATTRASVFTPTAAPPNSTAREVTQ